MRHRLINWVDAMCSLWGMSMRRIYMPRQDAHWPESVWARIQDGIPPSEFSDQKFLEVHKGDALVVARVLPVLTDTQRTTLAVHYVMPGSVKQKLYRIGKSRESHYEALSWIHRKLANAVEHGYGKEPLTKSGADTVRTCY